MPIPNVQAGPVMPDRWVCAWCRGTAYEVQLGKHGPWSIEIACLGCGDIGPDLHFMAADRSANLNRGG